MLLEERHWSEQKAFQAPTLLSQQEQIKRKEQKRSNTRDLSIRYPGVCSPWHGEALPQIPVQWPRTSVPLRCGRSSGPLRRGHLRRAACDVYFFMTENCKKSWACPFSPTPMGMGENAHSFRCDRFQGHVEGPTPPPVAASGLVLGLDPAHGQNGHENVKKL